MTLPGSVLERDGARQRWTLQAPRANTPIEREKPEGIDSSFLQLLSSNCDGGILVRYESANPAVTFLTLRGAGSSTHQQCCSRIDDPYPERRALWLAPHFEHAA